MSKQKPDMDKMQELAESKILVVVARLCGVIVFGLSTWTLLTVNNIQTNIAAIGEKVEGQGTRITTLETWRNIFSTDARADTPRKSSHK